MKLMALTGKYARKPCVRFEWGKQLLFFAGTAPAENKLIVFDFPGLSSATDRAVRDWLIAYHQERGRSGEHDDLGEELWRPAVLDDVLDTANGAEFIWHLSNHFTLREFTDFAEKHGPALVTSLRAALDGPKKAAALRKLQKPNEAIGGALYTGTRRLMIEVIEEETADDRAAVAKLKKFDANAWIDVCASLKSDQIKRELLEKIAKQLVKTRADIPAALDRMLDHKLDRVYAPDMWTALAYEVTLPPNVTGETIDVSKARELTVAASWEVYKGKRVGAIKPGRAALFLYDGSTYVYVRGERKLLHAIRERGGSITRYGCTLTLGKKDKETVQAKLLEVDRIDTLAHVDPRSAARLAGEDLPQTHPIAEALARAQDDPTWRRILADLLIERLVGIDADVARRLARSQAAANRRVR